MPYNAPVSRWGHVWRTLLCVAISTFVWWEMAPAQWHHARGLFWLDLALGLASLPLVFFRRRWPFAIAAITTVLSAFSGTASGPGVLAAVSLATGRRIPQVVTIGLLNVVASQVYEVVEPSTGNDNWWVNFSITIVVTVALLVLGMYIGSRRELLWTLRDRANQTEAQQELRLAGARSAERERIAREMHDVLAHRISLITMHAGALAYRTDLPPEQVRETAQLIQAKSHEALADLREVLGVLRGDDLLHRPQPTLADLDALVDEAVEGGMTVDLTNTVSGPVPDGVGRTIYRIVQEGLTNARKHAVGTHVVVTVSGSAGAGVDVELSNPIRLGSWATTPGAGMGLVGLKERTELAGGRLEVTDDRKTFGIHGWLPWPQ
ncbi:MAG: histidine kinase [Marmoricola sp.]|nr:histidine kinase [Marmoricola sp.]